MSLFSTCRLTLELSSADAWFAFKFDAVLLSPWDTLAIILTTLTIEVVADAMGSLITAPATRLLDAKNGRRIWMSCMASRE